MLFYKEKIWDMQEDAIVPFSLYEVTLTKFDSNLYGRYGITPSRIQQKNYSNANIAYRQGDYQNLEQPVRDALASFVEEEVHKKEKLLVLKIDGCYYESITGLEIPFINFYYKGNCEEKENRKLYWFPVDTNGYQEVSAGILPWNYQLIGNELMQAQVLKICSEYENQMKQFFRFKKGTKNLSLQQNLAAYLQNNYLFGNEKETEQELSITKEYVEERISRLYSYCSLLEDNEKAKEMTQKLTVFSNKYLVSDDFKEEKTETIAQELLELELFFRNLGNAITGKLLEKALEIFDVAYPSEDEKFLDELSDIIGLLKNTVLEESQRKRIQTKITTIILSLYQTKDQEKLYSLIEELDEEYQRNIMEATIPLLQEEENFDSTMAILTYLQSPTLTNGKQLVKTAMEQVKK